MSVQDEFKEYLQDQRDIFDRMITEDWDTYISPAWDVARKFEVAQVMAGWQPKLILDIGCGCGFHDKELAELPFVSRVDAFDYSAKSVEVAEAMYPHPKVRRFVADMATFWPANKYDLVVSFQVFEHLDDPNLYFARARALCSSNGRICIVTPNRQRLENRLRTWRGEPEVLMDPQHFKEYSIDELRQLGRAHGLRPIRSFGHTIYSTRPRWLSRLPMKIGTRLGSLFPAIAHVVGVEFSV
ncbi:class I SAM-dependent methyltransferase [Paramagnetospirillum kuznetsovii]|nr:class I SAM-dependent methyltransferase [Paramagnetospirillum kuznetsovii]